MDPTPWSKSDMSALERQLLEAARHDRVPHALGSRMAEGLGLQVAGAALQGGLAAGSRLGAPLFAKAGLWGVLSLALVTAVAGWQAAQSAPRAPRPTPASRASSAPGMAGDAVARAAAGAFAAHAVAPAAQEPASRAPGAAVPAPARPGAAADDAALRAEIALLDRAREALHDGASARVLRLLDQHRRRFSRRRLEPEAAALRIEALVQRGSYEQAGSMSQQFVSTYPSHPLSERVTKLAAPRASASPGAEPGKP